MAKQEELGDAEIEQVAEAYCADCVDFFLENAGISLDFSLDSLRHIEDVADHLHRTLPAEVDPARIVNFAKMLGSYVGVVVLQHVDGRWGNAPVPGEGFYPGLLFPSGGNCYPWAKAHHRLKNGSEDNLIMYAAWLLEKYKAKPQRSYVIKSKTGTVGPYSLDQLRELRDAGKITGTQVVNEVETNELKRVDALLAESQKG